MVNAGNNRYMQTRATPDGKQITLNTNDIYSIEYCAAYVEKDDKYVLKSNFDKWKQDNDELKAKMAALESKLNQISLSNYYTKSECDNQYTVKPPTIEVLVERNYGKDSNGYDKIAGHSGEHFIMHGLAPNGNSFNLNQIINEGEVIRLRRLYIL